MYERGIILAMSDLSKRLINTALLFLFMVLISLIWVVYNYPYTPQDVIDDTVALGKWGILIDILFVVILGRIWLKKETEQE